MLGAQTWFTMLGVPTAMVGAFVASRKRLAFQWREELMDPDGNIYPTVTDSQMQFVRRVTPEDVVQQLLSLRKRLGLANEQLDGAGGVEMKGKENIGTAVTVDTFFPEEVNALLNEVRKWANLYGNDIDSRKLEEWDKNVKAEKMRLAEEKTSSVFGLFSSMDADFYRHVRVIADHSEDIQLMKAPWGCGDSIDLARVPAALRYTNSKVQKTFDGIGRLRHVYMEYSPTGSFFRSPRSPKMFDGHDYVVIPLRRDRASTVVTLSPVLRSKTAFLAEVLNHSWTNRDIDVLVPSCGVVRVYGQARYDWGWGMRPAPQWFGSRLNMLDYRDGQRKAPWGRRLLAALGLAEKPAAVAEAQDAALIVLHYEGPRSAKKSRSTFLHPESLVFGKRPTVETFEKWVEDKPTASSVHDEGLVWFLLRNYVNMLSV